jgi:hypothetical protein
MNFSFMTNKTFDATIGKETFVLMKHHYLCDYEQFEDAILISKVIFAKYH